MVGKSCSAAACTGAAVNYADGEVVGLHVLSSDKRKNTHTVRPPCKYTHYDIVFFFYIYTCIYIME